MWRPHNQGRWQAVQRPPLSLKRKICVHMRRLHNNTFPSPSCQLSVNGCVWKKERCNSSLEEEEKLQSWKNTELCSARYSYERDCVCVCANVVRTYISLHSHMWGHGVDRYPEKSLKVGVRSGLSNIQSPGNKCKSMYFSLQSWKHGECVCVCFCVCVFVWVFRWDCVKWHSQEPFQYLSAHERPLEEGGGAGVWGVYQYRHCQVNLLRTNCSVNLCVPICVERLNQ